MIDEKKLIEDVLHNDGMDFTVKLHDFTPEGVGTFLQEYTNKLKTGIVNLIHRQPKILIPYDGIACGCRTNRWISTEEKLPMPFESVLIHYPGNDPLPTVREGYLTPEGYWIALFFHEALTMEEVPFWMPLPEPPKVGEGR